MQQMPIRPPVSQMARGEPVMMTSSWGLTETSPLATAAHFPIDRAGVIGRQRWPSTTRFRYLGRVTILLLLTGCIGLESNPERNKDQGRDHWPKVFSIVLAGGGIKRGSIYGSSDSIASEPARKKGS